MDILNHLSLEMPEEGRLVVTMKNGKYYSSRKLNDNEYIASLNVFLELAQAAGYKVVCPDKSDYNSK
ncbi:hypothetical protein ABU178_08380 [Pantoea osteomyelitidis]|uniref:Phage protein n=1 Tax=Pantoea osteomyelitidis TaxID=3230026 RepID=A0ABW7PWP7_9GAMM